MVVEVLVGEREVTEACVEKGWEERRKGSRLLMLGGKAEKGEACAGI